jgi:hypothetical protein
MKNLNKLIALLLTVVFSHSASAVIIEGSFGGQMWELGRSNMEVTRDAKFWDAVSWGGIWGTFWYDTEVAEQAIIKDEVNGVSATYAGPRNWLHTNFRYAYSDEILDLTSSGQSGTVTPQPQEEIVLGQYDDGEGRYDRFLMSYEDNDGESFRKGYFHIDPVYTFLDNLDLMQNYSLGPTNENTIVGYFEFENRGVLNGVEYSAWMVGEINNFDIHTKVPEPSALLLFFAPLLFLLWRFNMMPGVARKM